MNSLDCKTKGILRNIILSIISIVICVYVHELKQYIHRAQRSPFRTHSEKLLPAKNFLKVIRKN